MPAENALGLALEVVAMGNFAAECRVNFHMFSDEIEDLFAFWIRADSPVTIAPESATASE